MRNTQNVNEYSGYKAQFNKEIERAITYYNPDKRIPPEPFYPAKDLISQPEKIKQLLENTLPEKNISIYIHIPFCDRKCRFCDLYSFRINDMNYDFIERYMNALIYEIEIWKSLFALRKLSVTTIHLGGGSPLYLKPFLLEKLFHKLHQCFEISAQTEIAVEITSSQISENNIALMKSLGIKRIHVGIQTFHQPSRIILGRKENSRIIKDKIELLHGTGEFITSADILYGLPEQSYDSFIDELRVFLSSGFDGFALYELQVPERLNKYLIKNNLKVPSSLTKLAMKLQAKEMLNANGFGNVFFNHYGNERDKNLYFTYPSRHEDCISFGAIADGRIGDLYYRHKKIKPYIDSVAGHFQGFDYIYFESPDRKNIRLFEEQLMSAHITKTGFDDMIAHYGNSFLGVWGLWQAAGLLNEEKDTQNYTLTGSGCWFLSNMITQLRRLI